MDDKEQAKLRESIKEHLHDVIEDVFFSAHKLAGTKSGDITPDQETQVNGLEAQLAELIYQQTIQNL